MVTESPATETSVERTVHGAPASRRKAWAFRAAAVLLGLSVFLFAEGLCRIGGWGEPTNYDDPYVGFTAIHPLFVINDAGDCYETAKSRQKYFARDSFPAVKAPGTFRVFCIGGSTVQGRPYSIETSFPTWMKLGLAQAEPTREWEVVNCGGISYASYRLAPIVEECLEYEPDLVILCEGHNEFLEDRTYETIKHVSPVVEMFRDVVGGSRLVTLAREAVNSNSRAAQPETRFILPDDADALLNYCNGLRAYHRDDEWKAGVVKHFESNLRRMVGLCRQRNVPIILVLPPSNLAECPPFKSQHRSGLSQDQLDEWSRLNGEAHAACRHDLHQAVRLFQKLVEIDADYAATHYQLGKCFETLEQHEQARGEFVRARDLDVCPLRMISDLEDRMRRVADETKIPFLDAHQLLERQSRNGILGGPILCDRVHPSFEGNQSIADTLIEEMAGRQLVEPRSEWKASAHEAYRAHFRSLKDLYFLKGRRTLEAVEKWTHGQADGPPIETRAPHRIAPGD